MHRQYRVTGFARLASPQCWVVAEQALLLDTLGSNHARHHARCLIVHAGGVEARPSYTKSCIGCQVEQVWVVRVEADIAEARRIWQIWEVCF